MINENPIHKEFGNWKVHITGDLSNDADGELEVTWDRLTDKNWFLFGIQNGWHMETFFKAYWEAAGLIGLEEITFKIKEE